MSTKALDLRVKLAPGRRLMLEQRRDRLDEKIAELTESRNRVEDEIRADDRAGRGPTVVCTVCNMPFIAEADGSLPPHNDSKHYLNRTWCPGAKQP